MPSALERLKTWGLRKRVTGVLSLAMALLLAFHVASWAQAVPLQGATIQSAQRAAAGYREGARRRYELEVVHRGEVRSGFMDTYWFVGAPAPGEVLDLRCAALTGGSCRFFHGAWTTEFGSWLVVLALAGLALGGWGLLERRSRARSGEPPERSGPLR